MPLVAFMSIYKKRRRKEYGGRLFPMEEVTGFLSWTPRASICFACFFFFIAGAVSLAMRCRRLKEEDPPLPPLESDPEDVPECAAEERDKRKNKRRKNRKKRKKAAALPLVEADVECTSIVSLGVFVDRLFWVMGKIEAEERRLEEEALAFFILVEMIKLSPAVKMAVEWKWKTSAEGEEGDAFEELLDHEKKASFWHRHGKLISFPRG